MNIILKLNRVLAGWPGNMLSLALTAACLFGLYIAWFTPPAARAAVLAWFMLP